MFYLIHILYIMETETIGHVKYLPLLCVRSMPAELYTERLRLTPGGGELLGDTMKWEGGESSLLVSETPSDISTTSCSCRGPLHR